MSDNESIDLNHRLRIVGNERDVTNALESEQLRAHRAVAQRDAVYWRVLMTHTRTKERIITLVRAALSAAAAFAEMSPHEIARICPSQISMAEAVAYRMLVNNNPMLMRVSRASADDFMAVLYGFEHPGLHDVLSDLIGEMFDAAR